MNIFKLMTLVICLSCLWLCSSSNDSSLLECFEYLPKVNPFTGRITLAHYADFYINNSNEIYGVTSTYNHLQGTTDADFFLTANFFNSFFIDSLPESEAPWSIQSYTNNIFVLSSFEADKDLFKVIKSNYSGQHWIQIYSIPFNSFDRYYGSYFLNENHGWLIKYQGYSGRTYIYKFENGSSRQLTSLSDYTIRKIHFINPMDGYLIASDNHLFKTNDGGSTWSNPILIHGTDEIVNKFIVLNSKLIILSHSSSNKTTHFYTSNDNGETWILNEFSYNQHIKDICFASDEIAYIKSSNTKYEKNGFIYKSEDGGTSWTQICQDEMDGDNIQINSNGFGFLHYFIHQEAQVLYTTKDSGQTWQETLYPYPYIQ